VRDLPAHHQHQAKSKQQERQRGDAVLEADDFVVGRKNVGAPEARILMMSFVNAAVRDCVCGLHVRYFNRDLFFNRLNFSGSSDINSGLVNVSRPPVSTADSAHTPDTIHYFNLSHTITISSRGRYKMEKKKSCRARDTVRFRAN